MREDFSFSFSFPLSVAFSFSFSFPLLFFFPPFQRVILPNQIKDFWHDTLFAKFQKHRKQSNPAERRPTTRRAESTSPHLNRCDITVLEEGEDAVLQSVFSDVSVKPVHRGMDRRRRRVRPRGPMRWHVTLLLAITLGLQSQLTASDSMVEATSSLGQSLSHAPSVVENSGGYGGSSHSSGEDRRMQTLIQVENKCISSYVLHPGDYLFRGQFLCMGSLRFGIDGGQGLFMLGYAQANETSATPTHVAWQAIPTTIFVEKTREFDHIMLSPRGNLLGYDSFGSEIYDSHYDYFNRFESKEPGSLLMVTQSCSYANTTADGEVCVRLVSPHALPGMPYGIMTWGIEVHGDDVQVLETPPDASDELTTLPEDEDFGAPSTAPTDTATQAAIGSNSSAPVAQPSSMPIINLLPEQEEVSVGIISFETPKSKEGEEDSGQTESQVAAAVPSEPLSVIWGVVWLDLNRNGEMDLGEQTVSGFVVRLYDCTMANRSRDSNSTSESDYFEMIATTDSDGYYSFKVPSDGTYRAKFEVDDQHGYSAGKDASTSMLGWTDCETPERNTPIKWNAGLYPIDKDEQEIGFMPEQLSVTSSIGGFIYLDVDEDNAMDSKERTAAIGGYTVNDALIEVTLTDCESETVVKSIEISFPGTYSFSNLTEGPYKLHYEIIGVARIYPNPSYSFVDGLGNNATVYETVCGKLGRGVDMKSGNVGIRPAPIDDVEDNFSISLDDIEPMNSPVETLAVNPEDANKSGGGGLIPALIGVFATLAVLSTVAAILLNRQRREGIMPGKIRGDLGHDRQLSVDDDASEVSSSHSQPTAVGSLLVEASKSVAAFTTMSADIEMTGEGEDRSFTGMEFSLKGSHAPTAPSSVESNVDQPQSTQSNDEMIDRLRHQSSEGFEVYQEHDDDHSAPDYGPVISDMIAKYSAERQSQAPPPPPRATAPADGHQIMAIQPHQQQYHPPPTRQEDESFQYPEQGFNDPRHYSNHGQDDHYSCSGGSDPPAASYRELPFPSSEAGAEHAQQWVESVQQPGQVVPDWRRYLSTENDVGSYGIDSDSLGAIPLSEENLADQPPDTGWAGQSYDNFDSSTFSDVSQDARSNRARARSNPRDDRRLASWKQAAIPEHRPVDYLHNRQQPSHLRHPEDVELQNCDEQEESIQRRSEHSDEERSVISSSSDDPPGASFRNVPTSSSHGNFSPPRGVSPQQHRMLESRNRPRSVPPSRTSPQRLQRFPPPPPR